MKNLKEDNFMLLNKSLKQWFLAKMVSTPLPRGQSPSRSRHPLTLLIGAIYKQNQMLILKLLLTHPKTAGTPPSLDLFLLTSN